MYRYENTLDVQIQLAMLCMWRKQTYLGTIEGNIFTMGSTLFWALLCMHICSAYISVHLCILVTNLHDSYNNSIGSGESWDTCKLLTLWSTYIHRNKKTLAAHICLPGYVCLTYIISFFLRKMQSFIGGQKWTLKTRALNCICGEDLIP